MEITLKALLQKDIKDEVIVFQTDTVYGIGCKLDSEAGVKKIYALKNREATKPLPVLVTSYEAAKSLVQNPEKIKPYAEKYWPGALTLVTKKTDRVPDYVTQGFDTVGIRVPNDKVALQILDYLGPMAVTSLNISTQPAILTYQKALEFVEDVDYMVKGTDLDSISSTVYDVNQKKVLRQGIIDINT